MLKQKTDKRIPAKRRTKKMYAVAATVLLLAALMTVIFSVMPALSWLRDGGNDDNLKLNAGDFEVAPYYTFDSAPWSHIDSASADQFKLTNANMTNAHVRLDVSGKGGSYIRVKIVDVYSSDGDVIPVPTGVAFTCANGWTFYNGYYYFKDIVNENYNYKTENSAWDGTYLTTDAAYNGKLPFIDSVSGVPNGVDCTVSLLIESVQPDRFEAFFD